MKKLIIIVLLFIVSCNEYDHTKAIRYSKCTKEQYEKVIYESRHCAEESGYTKDYCYGSALMRNCEMVKP